MSTPYILSDLGDIQFEVDGMYLIMKLKPGVISGLGGGTVIDIIKNLDQKEATDLNVYSALRAKNEFLSKKLDDIALGKITFEKGFQIGHEFIHGLLGAGGLIDENGNAELESLTLRRFLEVPELRYNRVEINIGDKWNAPGGGIIQSVDTLNKTITLKLEEGEIGTVAVGDICMGIYHSYTALENEPENRDDSLGNRTFAGFATVYFKIEEILETGKNSVFRYSLRPVTERWFKQIEPFPAMHFVSYGNFTNTSRQTSRYATRTYERYLKGVNDWEFTGENIGAQFGDLTNLSVFGLTMTGYSAYLNNIYMSGTIQQFDFVKPVVIKYSSVQTPGNPTDNPENWSDTSDTNTIWMAIQTFKNGVASAWDILYTRGQGGNGDRTVYVFKDSASQPANPTGTGVPPVGWLTSITGNGNWWVSSAIVDGNTGLAGKPIGGINLYKKAQVITPLSNNPIIVKEADSDSANGFVVTGRTGGYGSARMDGIIKKNGSYVVSFWGKATINASLLFVMFGNGFTGDQTFTTEWRKFELKVTISNYTGAYEYLDIQTIANATYWIKDFKIEEGFSATGWCLAPEDIWSTPIRFNGMDSVTVELSQSNYAVSCNSSGVPKTGELGTSGKAITNVRVFKGATELVLGTGWSFGSNSASGLTYGALPTTPSTLYVINVTADLAYIDIDVVVDSVHYKKRFSVSKNYDGAQGTGGVSMVLTNDSYSVLCDSEGAPLPGQVGDGGKAITEVKVYLGGTLKTYGTDWTFVSGGVIGTGCTWRQVAGEPKIYIYSMTDNFAQVEINIQLLGVQLTKVFTVTKTITGAQGLQGALVRTTEHAIGFEYRNDLDLASAPRYLDVVTMYSGTTPEMYKCKVTHVSSSATQPPNETYWEKFNNMAPIYTSLILATNAVIRFMQNNQLVIQKSDGTVTAGMSGAVGNNGADESIRIWAGGAVPGIAPFRVNELGDVYANNGIFKGSSATPFSTSYTVESVSSTLKRTYLSFDSGFNFVFNVPDLGTTLEVYLPTDLSYSGVDCWLCLPYVTKSGGSTLIKVNGNIPNLVSIDEYGIPTFMASKELFWVRHLKAIQLNGALYWFIIK